MADMKRDLAVFEPVQRSQDGRITIQGQHGPPLSDGTVETKYRIEFLDRPNKHVFFLTEEDMIDIFNTLRGFAKESSQWEITLSDSNYVLKSKNDDVQMDWKRKEADGLMEAYITVRQARRGEF
jgi:hypothetical protein